MSCKISVFYPLLEQEECLDIPETSRAHGVVSFGSDTTVCFGAAPGAGGFVIEPWEAQEYGILPRHCALMWAGGKFRLEFDRRAGVYLNGSRIGAREFCNPFQDGSEARLKLGFPDSLSGADPLAPEFIIRREDFIARRPSFLDRLAKFRPIRWVLQFIYHRPSLVSFLMLLSVVAGITVVAFSFDQRITAALPHGAIPADLGRKIAPSVAAVGVSCADPVSGDAKFHSFGTAWLHERHAADASGKTTRWLVTNAHVASAIKDFQCPPPNVSEEAYTQREVIAYFPPINSGTSLDADGEELSIGEFVVHPLYDNLDIHFAGKLAGQGQPSLANVYDIAALELDDTQKQKLGNREPLKLDPVALAMRTDCLKALKPGSCPLSQSILPGRPLLVFGYPVENQPYLGQGVAAQPFEFRTTVQSRTNALSRTLPGSSTEAMPALYAFSARSSGGMSGGPVVASDGSGGYFVVGLVFAGTFVSTELLVLKPQDGPQPGAADATESFGSPETDASMVLGETKVRTSISDGAFAADVVSLDLLLDLILARSIENFAVSDAQKAMWNYWADRTKSLDQNHKTFADRVRNEHKCRLRAERWTMDKSLPSTGGGGLRGESASLVAIDYVHDESPNGYYKNPLLVTARVVSASGDEILQLSTIEKSDGRSDSVTTFYGVNSVSYLPSRTIKGEVAVAGPLNADVEVEVWTTTATESDCKKVQQS